MKRASACQVRQRRHSRLHQAQIHSMQAPDSLPEECYTLVTDNRQLCRCNTCLHSPLFTSHRPRRTRMHANQTTTAPLRRVIRSSCKFDRCELTIAQNQPSTTLNTVQACSPPITAGGRDYHAPLCLRACASAAAAALLLPSRLLPSVLSLSCSLAAATFWHMICRLSALSPPSDAKCLLSLLQRQQELHCFAALLLPAAATCLLSLPL